MCNNFLKCILPLYNNSSIAPISSKRIELSGAPSTGVGQTHSPGTMQRCLWITHYRSVDIIFVPNAWLSHFTCCNETLKNVANSLLKLTIPVICLGVSYMYLNVPSNWTVFGLSRMHFGIPKTTTSYKAHRNSIFHADSRIALCLLCTIR